MQQSVVAVFLIAIFRSGSAEEVASVSSTVDPIIAAVDAASAAFKEAQANVHEQLENLERVSQSKADSVSEIVHSAAVAVSGDIHEKADQLEDTIASELKALINASDKTEVVKEVREAHEAASGLAHLGETDSSEMKRAYHIAESRLKAKAKAMEKAVKAAAVKAKHAAKALEEAEKRARVVSESEAEAKYQEREAEAEAIEGKAEALSEGVEQKIEQHYEEAEGQVEHEADAAEHVLEHKADSAKDKIAKAVDEAISKKSSHAKETTTESSPVSLASITEEGPVPPPFFFLLGVASTLAVATAVQSVNRRRDERTPLMM